MMSQDDYKTMRVPTDAWEAAQSYRQEHGLTWGEYLRLPVDDDMGTEQPDIDADMLSDILSAATTAEERTGRIEQQLEQIEGPRV